MTTAPPDPKDLPLTKNNVGQRISMSPSREEITLDGEVIGTMKRQDIRDFVMGSWVTKTVWVATFTINGEEAVAQAKTFSGLSDRVAVVITGMLRRQNPDADRGSLVLRIADDDFGRIKRDGRGVLKFPYAQRFSRTACPKGRQVVLLNTTGRGAGGRIEAEVENVVYVQPPGKKRHAHLTVVMTAPPSPPEQKDAAMAALPDLPAETQGDICAWADATFAPRPAVHSVARALQEHAELTLASITRKPSATVAEEAADVAIILCDVAQRVGIADLIAVPPSRIALGATSFEKLILIGQKLMVLLNETALLDADTAANPKHPVTLVVRSATEQAASGLAALCIETGTTLSAAVAAKMDINRKRTWNRDGSGHVRAAQ